MKDATLAFAGGAPVGEGIEVASSAVGTAVPGPLPGSEAALGTPGAAVKLLLDRPLGARGGVMLWLLIDRARFNGPCAEEFSAPVFSVEGVCSLEVRGNPVCATLDWRFNEPVQGVNTVLLPALPGPQWVHFAVCWDAAAGEYRAYANGSPLILPGTKLPAWEMGQGREATVRIAPFASGGARVFDAPFSESEVASAIPTAYRGSLDAVLGARERGRFDPSPCRGQLLYERALSSKADVEKWTMEGRGAADFEDGWMRLSSLQPDGPMGHFVYWPERDFPPDYLAEWEIQPLSDVGLCIVFASARGVGGQDIFDPSLKPRFGAFAQYTNGDINSYHMSYYANAPHRPGRITCNMRKNSGFYLVDNGPAGIPPGSKGIHRVSLLKQGPRVRLAVDGRLVIDFHDDGRAYGPVLGGGKIGLRQMQWMTARYRNLRVWAPE